MPIYLPAPAHKAGGPDGQGWNRLSVMSICGDECALRPRSYPALFESHDTRRASYGAFGPCVGKGECDGCVIRTAEPRTLRSFGPRVLIRLLEKARGDGTVMVQPHEMNKPEDGWASFSHSWSWEELARLEGWRLGDRYRDEHGEGFWLIATGPSRGGVWGEVRAVTR
jgi:hypothetical protein